MLSASAQRIACRLLFLLLCVGPTLAVAGYTAARILPSWQTNQLASVSRQLGLRISCQRATTPCPGQIQLEDVTLAEPESGELVATINTLGITREGSRQVLQIGQLKVQPSATDTIYRELAELLRSDWLSETHLFCEELILPNEAHSAAWQRVRGHVSAADEAGREFRIWTVAEDGTPDALKLSIVRNRQVTPPATRIELQTGDQPLPISLIAELLPAPSLTGHFTGNFSSTTAGSDTNGRLAGLCSGLPVQELLATEGGGLLLNQPANIVFNELAWKGEQIQSLQASVAAGSGEATAEWIYALNSMLQCRHTDHLLAEWHPPQQPPIAFDQLTLSLSLDGSGFHLRGDESGSVLSRGGNSLLDQPLSESLPLTALLHFVAPQGEQLRPTGKRAEALARRLPLLK